MKIPIGTRVVLEVEGNLLFSGICRGEVEVCGRRGVLVETDPGIGLAVFCPTAHVKSLTTIPLPGGED
ncbi:MAG: hypothetical protein K6T75_07565 [Acetobacteraceae bacterium]|nr:hypothetical protein [Acetobacteraceae bacterium]